MIHRIYVTCNIITPKSLMLISPKRSSEGQERSITEMSQRRFNPRRSPSLTLPKSFHACTIFNYNNNYNEMILIQSLICQFS